MMEIWIFVEALYQVSTKNQLEYGHKDEKEGTRIIDNPLFFYAFIAFSFVFGFLVFFGIQIINKNWKQSYFIAVDKYIDHHVLKCFPSISDCQPTL